MTTTQTLKGSRFRARIYDQGMRVVHEEEWGADVPPNGYASEAHDVHWPIPSQHAGRVFVFRAHPKRCPGSKTLAASILVAHPANARRS